MKLISAEWCVNCKPIKQLIADNNYPIEVVDADRDVDLVREAGVRSIPCLLTSDGVMVVGTEKIKQKIKEVYGTSSDSN